MAPSDKPLPPVPGVLDPDTPADPSFDASDEPAEPDGPAASEERARPSPEAKAVTRRGARHLGLLIGRYGRRRLPKRPPAGPPAAPEPARLQGRLGQILPVMRLIPWLL